MADEVIDAPVEDAPQTDIPQGDVSTDDTPKSDASLLEGGGDDKPVAAPADWPEDWREKFANGDEKELKALERFKSPQDIAKSWREMQKRLSAGDLKPTLSEGASDEEVAEYRKANGIPDKPEGYLDALPGGLVVGDDDKPLVEGFLESAHGKNASPEFVASAIEWYYQAQEAEVSKRAEADNAFRQEAADKLRAEWGSDYRANLNSAKNFLDNAPVDDDGTPFKELLLGARLADGTTLGDNPTALRWLSQLASDANPAGFVSPGAGGSQIDSVKTEIASIEKVMREDRNAYNKDTKMQERLRALYDAEEKLGK